MTGRVQILHLTVIGPFVGHVEGRRDRATVGILPSILEQIRVKTFVQVVNRIVKGQQNNLRNFFGQILSCLVYRIFWRFFRVRFFGFWYF